MKKILISVVLIAVSCAAGAATTIALWDFADFNLEKRGGVDYWKADLGAADAELFLIGGVEYDDPWSPLSKDWGKGKATDPSSSSDPAIFSDSLDTATYPVQGVGNKTAGIEIKCPTTGYYGIKVSFDIKYKLTCSKYLCLQYSTDGGQTWEDAAVFANEFIAFKNNPDYPLPGISKIWFNNNAADLTSVSAADNNPNFRLRIVTQFAPGTNQYEGCALDGRLPPPYPRIPYAGGDNDSGGADNNHRYDMIHITAESSTLPAPPSHTILQAKRDVANWQFIQIPNAEIIWTSPDWFSIGSPDGSCALKVVKPAHNFVVGDIVNITGFMRTSWEGERYLRARDITLASQGEVTFKPVSTATKNVGGGDWFYDSLTGAGQKGLSGNYGLNNVGRPVKITGRITYRDLTSGTDLDFPNFIYVDDGSGLNDGNTLRYPDAAIGIKVLPKIWPAGEEGQYVSVTGVSCYEIIKRPSYLDPGWIFAPAIKAALVEVIPEN